MKPGHNRCVTCSVRAWRLVVVVVIALGLVGMHHLIVAACHHGVGHSDHAAVLSMDSVVDHEGHDRQGTAPTDGTPVEAPSNGSDGAPRGIVGAAATCLAILLMVVGLVLPQILARVRRWQALRLSVAAPSMAARTPKPPDLTQLSVSRT
ncbi:MAG: hypothetical protein RL347_120 [Actinomycetota bacterium]|jgi:hypothetical protein